jgi:hypothetical protein
LRFSNYLRPYFQRGMSGGAFLEKRLKSLVRLSLNLTVYDYILFMTF